MAQPFGVGDVVGGRYRISHHVVTSADQDIVFQATDEVLDREVSILLASRANAKQVATSAKELATGERDSAVQVLDLGLTDDRTYLISNQVDPNVLLDLVVPDAAPYVEPFFTDSLGQEIFGQSRIMEPETYEDDAEYYARMQGGLTDGGSPEEAPEEDSAGAKFKRRRPAFLNKVSDSLNKRLGTERDADRIQPASPGRPVSPDQADLAAAGSTGAPTLTLQSDMELVDARPEADGEESFEASADPEVSFREHAHGEDAAGDDDQAADEDSAETDDEVVESMPSAHVETVAHQAAPAAQLSTAEDFIAEGEEVVDDPPEEPVADYDQRPAPAEDSGPAQAPQPAPADAAGFGGERESEALSGKNSLGTKDEASSFTGLINAVPAGTRSAFPTAPGSAPGAESAAGQPLADDASGGGESGDTDFQDEKPTPRRWLGILSLAAILVVVAVVGFFALSGGEPDETAQEEPGDEAPAEEQEGADEGEEPAEEEAAPAPAISEVTRVVPDSPDLGADNDADLSNLHDGDESTTWSPGLFGTPQFGGFASTMMLAFELEEPATVTEVTVSQEGETTGGSFEVLVNDSPSGDGAETVGTGVLEWNDTTIELDEGATGQYLIVSITELPQQTPAEVDGLPYGLNLNEITLE